MPLECKRGVSNIFKSYRLYCKSEPLRYFLWRRGSLSLPDSRNQDQWCHFKVTCRTATIIGLTCSTHVALRWHAITISASWIASEWVLMLAKGHIGAEMQGWTSSWCRVGQPTTAVKLCQLEMVSCVSCAQEPSFDNATYAPPERAGSFSQVSFCEDDSLSKIARPMAEPRMFHTLSAAMVL